MGLHRLTSITLGVTSPEATASFLTDFGLHDRGRGIFATRDGGDQIELVVAPKRSLQRLGLGAGDGDDIARLARGLRSWSADLAVEIIEDDGVGAGPRLTVREPITGLLVEITVARELHSAGSRSRVNAAADQVERHDRPADAVLTAAPVEVSNLTHIVYGSPDLATSLAFFTEGLGFEISDQLPGVIAFTRCGEMHHNLALQQSPTPTMHHMAFEVDSVDDVVRGGSAMIERDAERHLWGVGRHAIGSNWFWYLREPSGNFVEYTSDIDRITSQDLYTPKDWEGREFLYSFGPEIPAAFLDPDRGGEPR